MIDQHVRPAAPNEIWMQRSFEAPRALVYRMWTDPDRIEWWWGPKGFSTTIREMDVRPGGRWRFVMHSPDGTDYDNDIEYLVVDEPNVLSYRHVTPPHFRMDVHFTDQGSKTLLSVRMTFDSAELRERVEREVGASQGLTQTLARLAVGTGDRLMNVRDDVPTIIMVREFEAPRELVFKAHIDPEMMQQWWAPYHLSNESVELEPRAGGTWCVIQRSGDTRHRFSGEYKEVAPPERILSTFVWGGEPDLVAEVTTTFEDLGNGRTRLTSTTTLPSVAARNEWLKHGAIGGGLQVYERLESLLSSQTRST